MPQPITFPKRFRITISQANLDNGRAGIGWDCPVALAVREHFDLPRFDVYVGGPDHTRTGTGRTDVFANAGQLGEYAHSTRLDRYLRKIDNGEQGTLKPSTFELRLVKIFGQSSDFAMARSKRVDPPQESAA